MGKRKGKGGMGVVEVAAIVIAALLVAVLGYAGASALVDRRAEQAGEDSARGFMDQIRDGVGEFFGKGEDGAGFAANAAEFLFSGEDGKGLLGNLGLGKRGDA